MLKIINATDFDPERLSYDLGDDAVVAASEIVARVRTEGKSAIAAYAEQFGERAIGDPLVIDRDELAAAVQRIDRDDAELLRRVAGRIETFAQAQLDSLSPLTTPVLGGQAGHTIEPLDRVGCYAPGGRYVLPSTVLMTAVTARVAGCRQIVVASPNPPDLMLAAASIAGADEVSGCWRRARDRRDGVWV